jgi:hypothetical protein
MTSYRQELWSSLEGTYGFLNGDMAGMQVCELPAAVRFGSGSDHHPHCAHDYQKMFCPDTFQNEDSMRSDKQGLKSGLGLEQFQTSGTPPVFELIELENETRLIAFKDEPDLDVRSPSLLMTRPTHLEIRWNYNGFMMRARNNAESQSFLRDLHSALERNDVYFIVEGKMRNASNFSGPTMMIASRVSKEFKRDWLEQDVNRMKLGEALKETKILHTLQQAGKQVFSVTPQWTPDNSNTEHPVVVFVNPMDQNRNSAGIYTIEELEDWATSDKDLGALDDGYIAARF